MIIKQLFGLAISNSISDQTLAIGIHRNPHTNLVRARERERKRERERNDELIDSDLPIHISFTFRATHLPVYKCLDFISARSTKIYIFKFSFLFRFSRPEGRSRNSEAGIWSKNRSTDRS